MAATSKLTALFLLEPVKARALVLRAIRAAKGNIKQAALALDLPWRSLYRLLDEHGLRDEQRRLAAAAPKVGRPLGAKDRFPRAYAPRPGRQKPPPKARRRSKAA